MCESYEGADNEEDKMVREFETRFDKEMKRNCRRRKKEERQEVKLQCQSRWSRCGFKLSRRDYGVRQG